jgi:hypothetical protein
LDWFLVETGCDEELNGKSEKRQRSKETRPSEPSGRDLNVEKCE